MTPARKWIATVVGLLGANILGTSVLIVYAHSGASRVIPEYYDRAVHYDTAIDQAAINRKLGWSVETTVMQGIATVRVRDRSRTPIDGATVRIEATARTGSEEPRTAVLVAADRGDYRGALAATGWIDLLVTVERGTDHFIERAAVEAR